MAATGLGVLAAGRSAILALAWRPLFPMASFVVLAVFWTLTFATGEVNLWALFPAEALGGLACGVGMAVSGNEGAIRWAADQEWSRKRSRGGPVSYPLGAAPRETPDGDRTIRECREGAPQGARRRNVLAEAAFAAGAAAIPMIPWLTAYWSAFL